MKVRKRKYREEPAYGFLILRDQLGLGRYIKQRRRDGEKGRILLEMALKKMEKVEKDDYIPTGFRRRRLRLDV
jgi:hypothetical protein